MYARDSRLKQAMGYRKFTGRKPLKVLVLHSGYHVQAESCRALNALGMEAYQLNVLLEGPGAVIKVLLHGLLKVKPDFVLCINHIGFDDRGSVGSLLEWLEVPLAVWYVDNPFFIIKDMLIPAPSVTSLFLWERTIVPVLQRTNVQDIHYLPLGCDRSQFSGHKRPLRYDVSFVGNSMVHADEKWTSTMTPEVVSIATAWRKEMLAKRMPMVERTLQLKKDNPKVPAWDILASATFSATGAYRGSLLRALPQDRLHVFGDEHWPKVLPDAQRKGMVTYGEALADVYGASAININATSLQMPTAVNQRVFDAPSSGGFLLTDAQPDLFEHFDVGEEVIAYEGPEHLAELCRYYEHKTQLRRQIVARAQQRIDRCHTYAHRLQSLVTTMQRRHGPMQPKAMAPSPS